MSIGGRRRGLRNSILRMSSDVTTETEYDCDTNSPLPEQCQHTLRYRRRDQAGAVMVIGDRLKQIRESKNMSQGDIESRTGLLRCYISRVENGHTVPALETLEKLAHALL